MPERQIITVDEYGKPHASYVPMENKPYVFKPIGPPVQIHPKDQQMEQNQSLDEDRDLCIDSVMTEDDM